jgi:hypothetical protein
MKKKYLAINWSDGKGETFSCPLPFEKVVELFGSSPYYGADKIYFIS